MKYSKHFKSPRVSHSYVPDATSKMRTSSQISDVNDFFSLPLGARVARSALPNLFILKEPIFRFQL